jgi:hypothetical protein
MQKKTEEFGDAYKAVRMIYDNSPGRSWQRLNGSLAGTLASAIEAHLSFLPGDFSLMRRTMSGHYWMGNSEGDVCGERFYSMAVKFGHTPACISFEQYAERPAALWPEDVKTPARLCIGSDMHWQGIKVAVTNIRENHLILCSYKEYDSMKLEIGSTKWIDDKYRKVTGVQRHEDGLTVAFGSEVKREDLRKVDRRFKVTFADLKTARKVFDDRQKQAIALIDSATDKESLALKSLAAGKLGPVRPFDLKAVNDAIAAKEKSFEVTR